MLQPLEARAPSDPQLLHLLGTALSQRGELQAANRYLSRAAELTPDPTRLKSKVALNHLISGDPDAALAELDSAETDDVPAAESLRILAYLEKGDVAGAMQAAERLASAYPDAPSVHNALGVVSERAGDLIGAEAHCRKARALDGRARSSATSPCARAALSSTPATRFDLAIDARIINYGSARTLYQHRKPRCRSLDGVKPISQRNRLCCDCRLRAQCTPQVRLDLIVEGQALRLLLAHTSAKSFLVYEAQLRQRHIAPENILHRIEVINRGSWGELRFTARD